MADAPPSSSLVALRDRREAVIQTLTDCFAGEVISIDEFDERVARAHGAASVAELDALVADLAPPPSAAPSTALVPLKVDTALAAPARRLTTVFGSIERRGAWTVPASIPARVVFGTVMLDFREAQLSARVTELDATIVFGNLELIVPPQLAVECEGSTFFGNVESAAAVADPERPILRVRGTAVFGNLEIHVRLPGESARDARKRTKRERRELAEARRGALPARK